MKNSITLHFTIFFVACGGIDSDKSLGKRSDFPDQKMNLFGPDTDSGTFDEKHMSNLKSESAFVYEGNDNLLAIGNVIVKSDSGVTLFTDSLFWDNQSEKINSNDTVMLATELNDTLYGIGFESDIDLTRWKILKPWGVSSREK